MSTNPPISINPPMSRNPHFDAIAVGDEVAGRPFTVTTETIQAFGDASLDYNPLHFDPDWMKDQAFGHTRFGGVIMHGMQNFAIITRTLTDWLVPKGGYHRRLETRWVKPVQLGQTITAKAIVTAKQQTEAGAWVLFNIVVTNEKGEKVATGEAMADFLGGVPA